MATTMETAAGPVTGHQPEGMRPRSKSAFSITSDKSEGSKRSGRDKLRESHDEKKKLALSNTTKANPNAAMNELQPIAQQLAPSTLGSLRTGQHLDMNGNPITDPDLSNPTRRRMERPLETIMSFEAAIDREFRRQREAARQSIVQHDSGATDYNGYESRRSSSYWGPATDGHYSQRNRSSYFADSGYNNSRSRFGPRQFSDSALTRHNNASVYSTPGYGQTRDTINTGGSGGSGSDPWHNSTDPSSDNSSVERIKAEAGQGHHGEYSQYGASPQREPISENGHYTYGPSGGYNPNSMNPNQPTTPGSGYYGQQFDKTGGPPPPPPKALQQPPAPRPVMKLDSTTGGSSTDYTPEPRRKSWLKRTFSKNKA